MNLNRLSNIRGDLFGGFTAGIVALPLAMAFGVQSGLGAEAGLYGAIAIGIVASIFGGTPTQVSGPTGPMTVVSSVIAATLIAESGSIEAGLVLIMLTFFLAGGIQIIFGLTQIGNLIKFIPYSVVSGFMSGIGIIIIVLQIFPMLGHSSPSKIIEIFFDIAYPLTHMNLAAVMLGLITIATIYLFPLITKVVPSTLIALVLVSSLPALFNLEVPMIGDIPKGIPHLDFSIFEQISGATLLLIMAPALSLATLGSIDSLLTSVVADNITKTKHNSNRELIGQGLGNMVAALMGGIPGAGATMRTVVNIRSGGKTRLSGITHGLFLLALLLGLGKYAASIPLAVLAGILITVGIGIIDYRGLRDLFKVPRSDAVVKIIVILITVFIDLLWAVGTGLVLSALFFVKFAAEHGHENGSVIPFKEARKNDGITDTAAFSGVHVWEIYGPLFFGLSSQFQRQISAIKDIHIVVFRLEHLSFADQSGMYALMDTISDLQKAHTQIIFCGVNEKVEVKFKKLGIIGELVPESSCFETFEDASVWVLDNNPTVHQSEETLS